MRLLIVTPLYPPDVSRLAAYVKELAKRLSASHTVNVVTYGAIPEQIPGVQVICISKHLPVFLRLPAFTLRLWIAARRADALFVCDGASVGIPSVIAGKMQNIPVVRYIMEDESLERKKMGTTPTKTRWVDRFQRWTLRHATRAVAMTDTLKRIFPKAANTIPLPPERKKIFPPGIETPLHTEDNTSEEAAWDAHLSQLQSLFTR